MHRRSRGALAVPAVFAALVVATFAAFFVTTKLKRSPPVVEQLQFRRHFSPNGDGRLDNERISFRLRKADDVTVAIVSADNDEVATLADGKLAKGKHAFTWDGRDDAGKLIPDGEYHVLVRLRRQGRAITSPRKLFVDTTAPVPVVKYVTPDAIYPGAPGPQTAHIRFVGPTRKPPTLLVYRTGAGNTRLVARRTGHRGSARLTWDGRVGLGVRTSPAPPGNYLFVVRARDAAGNDGPVAMPPRRSEVRGHPGIVVRKVAAVVPRAAVVAGTSASIQVLTGGRRYSWQLKTLQGRRVASGRGHARQLKVHVPRRTRTGALLFAAQVAGANYATPLAVQGRTAGKLLVALPAATWVARDPLDSNGDGYSDVLPLVSAVPLSRPLSGSGLPTGFSGDVAPLLRFLDRNGLRYDLTTDLDPALIGKLGDYPGVLFAGSPQVELAAVSAALRRSVRSGRNVAWVGNRGLTLAARVDESQLLRVPSPRGRNAFGESLRVDPAGGLLNVQLDRVKLFAGVPDAFGPFGDTELQIAAPAGSTRVAAAGPQDQGPAISALRVGDGLVVRVGVARFGSSLSPGSGITSSARIMRNLWNLLRS